MKIARLTKILERRVRRGEWSSDGPLPSRNLLSEEYGVSPATVSIAIRSLEKEGLVRIVPRKGVFIVESEDSAKADPTATIGLRGGYLPSEAELLSIDARQLFGQAIFNGIWETAHIEHCPLLLLPGNAEGRPLTLESCRESGVRGVIFMGGRHYDEALALRRQGFPVILANRPVGGTPMNYVDYDAAGELREILNRFVALGHRRIGILCPSNTSVPGYYARLKLDFISLTTEHGLYLNPEEYWKTVNPASGATIDHIIHEWSRSPAPPTALFAWAPDLAREFRRKVPRSLQPTAIACSGYLYEREADIPGFVMPHRECGAALLSGLHATIRDPFHIVQQLIPCRFAEGENTLGTSPSYSPRPN